MTGYPDDWDRRRRLVYERDDYTCRNCGRSGGPVGDVELHCHHIVPKGRGGAHHTENLVTLCEDCHRAVHNRGAVAPTAGQEDAGAGFAVKLYSVWNTYKRLRQLF